MPVPAARGQSSRAAALVAAAVHACDEDEAAERARFFATAARGRPETTEGYGRLIALREAGTGYELSVLHAGRDRYRVEVGGRRVDASRARDGTVRISTHDGDVTASVGDGTVVVAGHRFEILRDDRGIVRVPCPAVVVAIRVHPGQQVQEGDPLVVLEAMKMEMAVRAPHAGWVRRVCIGTNQQVGAGADLVELVPSADASPPGATPARFDLLPEEAVDASASCRRTLAELRDLFLGYDVAPSAAGALADRLRRFPSDAEDDPGEIERAELDLLEIFADVAALSEPTEARMDGQGETLAREQELQMYLRDLDAMRDSLSVPFLVSLRRALAHHGVTALERTPQLEDAMLRLSRSQLRAREQQVAVLAVLDRWLGRIEERRPRAGEELQGVLDRLWKVARHRYPAVSDLARDARYRYFDQPLLDEVRRRAYHDAEAMLDRLRGGLPAPEREVLVRSLVECGQPLKRMLTERAVTDPGARSGIIEVLARRYYRIRELRDARSTWIEGRPVFTASYPHDGTVVHLVATFAMRNELVEAATDAARVVGVVPPEDDVALDLYLWHAGPPEDPERASAEIGGLLDAVPFGRPIRRVVVAMSGRAAGLDSASVEHFTFRPSAEGYQEERLSRGFHPMMGKRLGLDQLSEFRIDRLPSVEDVYLFRGVARDNPRDERLFAFTEVRDMTPTLDQYGRLTGLPQLELMVTEALEAIRLYQSHRPDGARLQWNRVLVNVWPQVDRSEHELFSVVRKLAPLAEGLGLEKVVVRGTMRDPATGESRDRVLHISNPVGRGLVLRFGQPSERPVRPLSEYMQKVVQARQRGLVYPYEIVRMLTPPRSAEADFPPGAFREMDLDASGRLGPVERPFGRNTANIVAGIITSYPEAYPDGMSRVAILGDPTRSLGSLAEPECRRICAALDLAEELEVPLEWFAVSAGAKISMTSGTENMDWIGRVLRRLVEFTQHGGEVNVVVCGINVGAQPYWNAEATMLMHTRGILVMTPDGSMVLTGKQALDYSGGVSAEDNVGIGGFDRVMGPNGQAQYWASDIHEACRILLRHYEHTYVLPGERFPRRVPTTDPRDRDVCASPHRPDAADGFATVGDIFSEASNPGRKKPFDIRSVMRAVIDGDRPPLERWGGMRDAEIAVVWDAHLGGIPVCLLGIESRPLPRQETAPADGPELWTSGTLFPLSSKKIARAINAASGNRPVVVLANLSGFDGSPESLRKLQLEYGAEIGRAVVNFRGPIVFCVISRYHGGAFVVFSRALNEGLEVAAVEGSYASVIGGAPAAAVVFSREVGERTSADPRVHALTAALDAAAPAEKARMRTELDATTAAVRSEKLGEVANEFDRIHTIYRALDVGSVDRIIAPSDLRPYLIDAVERGMARASDGIERHDPRQAAEARS